MTAYAEFRVRIEHGASRRTYRVEASGLGGEEEGRFRVPFTDTELENFILKIGRTRRGVRRIESPEMELARTFGGQLFSAVMDGKVGELYRAAFVEARAAGQGLRVTLSLTDVPELGAIPWEYLYDSPDFLSISSFTPVVRYLDLPKPRRALEVQLPLRILGVVSAPSDAQTLDTDIERTKLAEALRPLIDAGAVTIDWLEEANLLALARKLRPDTYHILHYIGHGGFDDTSGEGALLFEDEVGRGRLISGDQLATILRGKSTLRLVLLNSCEGARNSVSDPFSGVAASLVQREIPAVIGMQFEITDRAAILFAGEFYSMLAEGQPVDAAVTEARLAIFADHNDVEWATPVLFMRVADGRLFDIANAAALPRRAPDDLPAIIAPIAEPPTEVAEPGIVEPDAGTGEVRHAGGPTEVPTPPQLVFRTSDPDNVTTDTDKNTFVMAHRAAGIPWPFVAVGAVVVLIVIAGIFVLMSGRGGSTGSIGVNTAGSWETGQALVTGSDFTAGETVDIILNGAPVGKAVVLDDGSFSATINLGSQTAGTVSVKGRSSGRQANHDFVVPFASGSAGPSLSGTGPSTSPGPGASTPVSVAGSSGILFYGDRAPGSLVAEDDELYHIDPATGAIVRLTDNAVRDTFPTWSPDRTKIAFTRGVSPNRKLVICDLTQLPPTGLCEGAALEDLTSGEDDYYPTWSRDDWIAFVRTNGRRSSIFKIMSNGSAIEEILPLDVVGVPPILRGPSWSPDGTLLALFGGETSDDYDLLFVGGRTTFERYTDRDRGTDVSELTPTWSPDGRTIVFAGDVGLKGCDNRDLYLLDYATRKVTDLVVKPDLQDGNPAWSLDGRQIAFYEATKSCLAKDVGFQLWVTDSDGTDVANVMPDRLGRNLDPQWR